MTVTEAAAVPPVAPLAAADKTKKKQPDLSLGMPETNCIIVDCILFIIGLQHFADFLYITFEKYYLFDGTESCLRNRTK
jgi:hypothetical protein